jgi:hypothetical protein
MHLRKWQSAAQKLASKTQSGNTIFNIFGSSLEWIYSTEYRGGCHDTSAAIYILLSEQGLSPHLCIGEVKYSESYFDHSWIEVNNKIYDAAICMPLTAGIPSSPVFASVDLMTGLQTELIYGLASSCGYDEEAQIVSAMSLGEYSEFHDNDPNKVWSLTKTLGKEAGMKINIGKIREKYRDVRRIEKHSTGS